MNSRPCSSEQYLLILGLVVRAGFLQPFKRHIGFHVVWPFPASLQLGPVLESVEILSLENFILTNISLDQFLIFLFDIDTLPMKPVIAPAVTANHPRMIIRSAADTEHFVRVLNVATALIILVFLLSPIPRGSGRGILFR